MLGSRRLLAAGLCAALACLPLAANAKSEAAPDDMTGLKVGEKAPGFTLKDQNGDEHSLADLTKKGRVALVFYRSANW